MGKAVRRARVAGWPGLAAGLGLVAAALGCSSGSTSTPLTKDPDATTTPGGADAGPKGAAMADGGASKPGGNGGGGADAGPPADHACRSPLRPPARGVWTEIPGPQGVNGFRPTDAFAAGPDDLFFAGNIAGPDGAIMSGSVVRFRHGCWTVELAVPTIPVLGRPSVHGTSTTDVWATVGDKIFHRDAHGWSEFDDGWRTLVTLRGPSAEMTRVRAAGRDDLWVTESNNVLHWTPAGWTAFNFDDPGYPTQSGALAFFFFDIWIDGPADVWVSGAGGQVGSTMPPAFVHHFDGTSWTRTSPARFSVYGLRREAGTLWLAIPGNIVEVDGHLQEASLFRYNGDMPGIPSHVEGSSLPAPAQLRTLWGSGAGDLWASGNDVARFDGASWKLVEDAPAPARMASDFDNTLVTGDRQTVWLVTVGPRFFVEPMP